MSQTVPQGMPSYQPDQMLSATLQAQEWNIVLAGLSELPYRMSNQVIIKLQQQLQPQPGPVPMPEPVPIQHKPNGHDPDAPVAMMPAPPKVG
jgi:hypothetical protein